MKMKEEQFELIKAQLKKLTSQDCFYQKKLEGINVDDIKSQEDFEKLPFTWKGDLREAYPLGLRAVPEEEIVRIHSSSGTTGIPVIIPYTKKDIDDWATMFSRCYKMAGVTNKDRIHITPGYGLWTAGIGFQNGAEKLGAMTIPMGPGNTDKQLRMMVDMESTVLCATSSYALLLAEEIAKRGIGDKIKLKKGIIGSERWGDKMRKRIANELGVKLYDIYGLTEIEGPGVAFECEEQNGMHICEDYFIPEIVDPDTFEPVPDGQIGELVFTSFAKEAFPLIRYRTKDITYITREKCKCGRTHARIHRLMGRSDDMLIVKGVNVYPSQVEEVLIKHGMPANYQLIVDRVNNSDTMEVLVEMTPEMFSDKVSSIESKEKDIVTALKSMLGIYAKVKLVEPKSITRSEGKAVRVIDKRKI